MATITTPTGATVSASAKDLILTAGAGLVVVIGLYWLAKREVKAAAGAVVDFADTNLNPTKPTNLAYRAASSAVKVLGGDPQNTLGGQIYDDVQSAKILLNPKNDQNIVNKGVTAVVQGVTGSKDATLGTAVYDSVQWFKSVF